MLSGTSLNESEGHGIVGISLFLPSFISLAGYREGRIPGENEIEK